MRLRLYPRPEAVIWLGLTVVGAATSALSLRELRAGVEAIRKVGISRPHAQDVIRMAEHNEIAEVARLIAQCLFFVAGVASVMSRPRVVLGRPRPWDRLLPWVLVLVEGILVGNSLNEYLLGRRVLKRRARMQSDRRE